MAANLLWTEEDGSIGFGDFSLPEKQKAEDYPHDGDLLKVKTFKDITKLEKNGLFLYESVPGTRVEHFVETADGVAFEVSGDQDAQITLGLQDDTLYDITVDGEDAGAVQTGLGGKLSVSVELAKAEKVSVQVKKA